MKFVRFSLHGQPEYGLVDGQLVRVLDHSPFDSYNITDTTLDIQDLELLSPTTPTKALAIGLNYRTHIGDREPPSRVEPFLKTPNAIIGPNSPIVLPAAAGKVDEEGELVIVMGSRCSRVTKESALSYVLGYTCGIDVSARLWQGGPDKDLQWWRAKSADTFGPTGPFISTEVDPLNFELLVRVNGQEVQHGHSSDLVYDIPTCISAISAHVTLEPGDLIFTGTPGKTTELKDGDIVEVEIPGIGILSNPVVSEERYLGS